MESFEVLFGQFVLVVILNWLCSPMIEKSREKGEIELYHSEADNICFLFLRVTLGLFGDRGNYMHKKSWLSSSSSFSDFGGWNIDIFLKLVVNSNNPNFHLKTGLIFSQELG